jgi:hypothetical protein
LSVAEYEEQTADELEARFRAGEGFIDDPVQADPEPPPAEPTPEPEQPIEEPAEPEPVAAEAVEPEFDERAAEIEEMRLRLEKADADNRRLEYSRGREAGELGFLRQRVQGLEQMLNQVASGADPEESRQPGVRVPVQPPASVDQSRLAELEQDARAGAIQAEYHDFLAARGLKPEEAQGVIQKLAPAIQEQWQPYAEHLSQMSARSVRKVLRTILDSSYADMRLQELRTRSDEARRRKAEQVPAVKKAKLAAGVAGSGGASSPAPRPKSPEEYTAEEADAALTRQYGRGRRVGR